MSEQELKNELIAIRHEQADQRKMLIEHGRVLRGNPADRTDNGLVGDVLSINQTLHGPPGQPDGLVGMVKEMRVTTRTIIVGVAIAVGSGIAQKVGLIGSIGIF